MRITFVVPDFYLGGGALVVVNYANGLVARGHHVTVVACEHARPTVRETLRSIARNRGLPKRPATAASQFVNVNLRSAPAKDIANGKALPDADVLIATWWETVEWVESVGPQKGRKIHFVQDIETFDYLPQNRVHAVLRNQLPKIAVSQWVSGVAKREFGAKEIHLIENAVDASRFDAPIRKKNARLVFGFLFSDAARKNTALALESLTAFKEQFPDVKAISFGLSEAQLPAWIEYHRNPTQDTIPKLYSSCDAWLFTSTSEGFGLPILEAMASRTPVIATPAGAAPQLVNDQNGQIVDFSVTSVVAAMRRISDMAEGDWRTLSDNAYMQASKHSWQTAIDKMEKILRSYAT